MDEYSYQVDVGVRFRDLDTMNHVNNSVYATYLEEARVGYFEDVLELGLHEVDTVLATLSIDFQRPITLGDRVSIGLRIPSLGRSSIPMEYEIRANETTAATAETLQVVIDREAGNSRPIPDEWRRRIESHEGLEPSG